MANQVDKNEESLLANQAVEKTIRSFTDEFDNIGFAIEESKDL